MTRAARLKVGILTGLTLLVSGTRLCLASGGEEQPSLFSGDIGNALWTTIIFLLLLLILKRYAWGPMLEALRRREQFIAETIESARKQREEAEHLLQQYREQLEKAQSEAQSIIEQSRRRAEEIRQRLHEQARVEAERMLREARQEIETAKENALRELYDAAADLAVGLAGKILKRELSAEDHRRLIEESLSELSRVTIGGKE